MRVAERMFALLGSDRTKLLAREDATVAAVRLLDLLPANPVVTLPRVVELLGTTKPTAGKAIGVLQGAGVLQETSGKRRDRIYAYQAYLDALTGG